ncbi:MAG TPA: SigB/SigF/SigG family RNA polymerase sigma factor [Solirubrobacteraceae bacterium]|jgi:RNA polymerase sigma-B factor|nr:SigB/SigF/SigG family RNA polymerase sigma factor [Solirubrobacteraceae bacterium]
MGTCLTPRQSLRRGAIDDTDNLIARWREEGDDHARELVIERFLPMARRLASRYRSPYEPLEDLIQVACVGLLGAIDRFDPERGVTFASFAVPTILGEIKRHFRRTGWALHVPRGAQEMALRIDRARRELSTALGRQPQVGELAQYLEVSAEDVLEGLSAATAHYALSLDAPVASTEPEEALNLVDTIGRDDGGYALVDRAASLVTAVAVVPYLERQALHLRLTRDLKQAEIARELGCSQMQVSRLLRRASDRLLEATAA